MKISDTLPLPGYPVGASLPGRRVRHYGWNRREMEALDLAQRQRAAYVAVMGHEPPESEDYETRRQFFYNRRCRDAKDILAACRA